MTADSETQLDFLPDPVEKSGAKFKEDNDFKAHNERSLTSMERDLRDYVSSYQSHKADVEAANDEIKALTANMKAMGYSVKALRRLIANLKRDAKDLADEEATLELYTDVYRGSVQ